MTKHITVVTQGSTEFWCVLMLSHASGSVWLHHTHAGDVSGYCFIQQMCEAITPASTPLFECLFDSIWVLWLADFFLVLIWFLNELTETKFSQGTGNMRSNSWMQKTHLAVQVGSQYMAACYFPPALLSHQAHTHHITGALPSTCLWL